MIRHDNTPVGIVVTDWFNLSLYRIASDRVREYTQVGMVSRTSLSRRIQPQHQQPHLLIPKEFPWLLRLSTGHSQTIAR